MVFYKYLNPPDSNGEEETLKLELLALNLNLETLNPKL
jgi:hypothetical protein